MLKTRMKYLKCKIKKGMFSDERAITIQHGNKSDSFFVAKENIRGKIGEEGTIRVKTFHRDGGLFAILPTEYSFCLSILKSQLKK